MYIVHRVWNYGSLLDLQYMRALSSEALSGAFMSSLLGIIGVSVNLKMSSFSANLKKKSQDCSLFVHRKGAAVVYKIIIL